MTGLPPARSEFDPAVDDLPEALDPSRLPERGAGRVVTLLSTGGAEESEWHRECVVAIAKAWAGQGIRVFLADLGLERPTLHGTLGVPNEEGISDMFRFGASVQRVAHRVGDLPFFFTSAGAPVFGSEEILRSERWPVLIEGFAEAGAALVLYLPSDEPGADAILAQTTDLVVLGHDEPESLSEDVAGSPLAWLVAPGSAEGVSEGLRAGSGRWSDSDAGEETADPSDIPGAAAAPPSAVERGPEWSTDEGASSVPFGEVGEVEGGAQEGIGEDPPSEWGPDLESADTRSFEVPGVEAEPADLDPEGGALAGDMSADDWDDVAPGLEIAPELGGSADDGIAPVHGGGEDELDSSLLSEKPGLEPTSGRFEDEPTSVVDQEPVEGSAGSPSWAEEPSADRDPAEHWGAAPSGSGFSAESDADPPDLDPVPSLSAQGDPRDGTRGSRRWLVWGGAAAIVVLGAWQLGGAGLFSRDGAGGAGGEPPTVDGAAGDPAIASPDGAAEGTTAVAAADIDPGEPTSPLQDASLVIQSFPNAAEAQEFADRLSENLGELLFTVVPSSVNGQTWYRTMAGPARDISEIPGIQERIQQANLSMLAGRTGWFPRRTGLAFLLTEERTLAEADTLAQRYRGEGIPAYVMAVDYSAGVRLYRVYAGGYAGEDESAPLARLLSDAGVDADLVPRLGSMPSGR